jgi:hypothetical protein
VVLLTPLAATKAENDKFLGEQKEITELYSELTYAELKNVLEGWLNPSAAASEEEKSVSAETLSSTAANDDEEAPFDTTPSKPAAAPAKKLDDVAAAFDDLFNS